MSDSAGGSAVGVQVVKASTAARIMRRANTGVVWNGMERIDVTSGRPPAVDRPEGSNSVLLTFDGLRDANVRDRDTRIKIACKAGKWLGCGVCSASG